MRNSFRLHKILVFSALTGVSFGISIRLGGETSGSGFGFLVFDFLSEYSESNLQALIIIISSIFSIFFIIRLAKFFREILENRLIGIATSVLGFSGSFLLIYATQESTHFMMIGIGLLAIGTIIIFSVRKK